MARFDRFSRRDVLAGAAAGLALGAGVGPAHAQTPRVFRWGSSSIGSTGYVIIEALANTVNRHTDLRNSALATAGGTENMSLIGEGQLELGQTTSTDWPPASKGEPPFPKAITAYQMFSYTVWNIPLIVRADSGIRSVADLAGRRVMPSAAGSGTALMWRTLLEGAGVADKVRWTYGSWNETYNAFKAGAVDAVPAVLTNGRISPQGQEVQTALKIRVLDYPSDAFAKANAMNPGLLNVEVAPQAWDALEAPKPIPSISGILAVSPAIREEDAYKITRAVYDHTADIRKLGVQLQDIREDFATRFLMPEYPVHAGAARYFKEKGLWRDELKTAAPRA